MGRHLISIALACLFLAQIRCGMAAWKAPQDNWMYERQWATGGAATGIATDGTNVFVAVGDMIKVYTLEGDDVTNWGGTGNGIGQLSGPTMLAWHSPYLYVADTGNHRIEVFESNGNWVRSLGAGLLSSPRSIAFLGSNMYVAEPTRITVLDAAGSLVERWTSDGTHDGSFGSLYGIAAIDGCVYVADTGKQRIRVFDPAGNYVRGWGLKGLQAWIDPNWGKYEPVWDSGPYGLAVDGDNVYTTSGKQPSSHNARLQVYKHDGTLVWQRQCYYRYVQGYTSGDIHHPRGIVLSGRFILIADQYRQCVFVYRQMHRTEGGIANRSAGVPTGTVVAMKQRVGSGILDIDYILRSSHATTVFAYPLAFTNATPSLNCCVPLRMLAEGTEANIGRNVTVGVTNRISWNVGADWNVGYGDLRIAILAKDDRNLLDLHFLHMPAVGANPPLTINRYPITANDLLNLWFWVIASGNPGANLANGEVRGVGGAYDGVLLANDTATTAAGRTFLFALLGYRQATADELQRAREASTPGSVTKWESRWEIPLWSETLSVQHQAKDGTVYKTRGRPRYVNEFGFDTGSTDADGWWVVKE